ncbi:hypothetical protein [Solibaculum mannosilyticum]
MFKFESSIRKKVDGKKPASAFRWEGIQDSTYNNNDKPIVPKGQQAA